MPRPLRIDVGEMVYHVINRANNQAQIFQTEKDYRNFEALLSDLVNERDMRILAYCIMPNHWHLVLHTRYDGHLAKAMQWLTTTHSTRWHTERHLEGSGHLYQGRYKSFPVERDVYLLQLIRYVERNPFRAKLVRKAEDWPYSSLFRRKNGNTKMLSDSIIDLPEDYFEWVNEPDTELDIIRDSVNKSRPLGAVAMSRN